MFQQQFICLNLIVFDIICLCCFDGSEWLSIIDLILTYIKLSIIDSIILKHHISMTEFNQIILYSTQMISDKHSCQQQQTHITIPHFYHKVKHQVKTITQFQSKDQKISKSQAKQSKGSHSPTQKNSFLQNSNGQLKEEEDYLSDFQEINIDDESIFQFSQEIMLNNPRKESRQQRQKNKLAHLRIFDWMMKTSTTLKLNKQSFYRSAVMIKKFLFLQQKTSHSKVTVSNVNLYGLAALLIASKYQNVAGNFLNNISRLIVREEGTNLSKECVLECEQYILRILGFRVPNKSIIIEVTLQVIYKWDSLIAKTQLQHFKLGQGINFNHLNQEIRAGISQIIQKDQIIYGQNKNLLQILLWLIDYGLMRKLVELKIKELHLMQNHNFLKKYIANILYHLFGHILQFHQIAHHKLQMFKKLYLNLVQELTLNDVDKKTYLRKSHLLSKQIRKIFGKQKQKQKFKPIRTQNIKFITNYCSCRHISKYTSQSLITDPQNKSKDSNISMKQSKKDENNQFQIETLHNKNEIDYDTYHIEQSEVCLINREEATISNKKQRTKNICHCSLPNIQATRLLADRQFYFPLMEFKGENQQAN